MLLQRLAVLIRQSQITTWLKQNGLAQQESDIRRVEGYIELSLFFQQKNQIRVLAICIIFVVVFPAAVTLRENYDEENGSQTSDAAPKAEDAADDGFDFAPKLFVLGGASLLARRRGGRRGSAETATYTNCLVYKLNIYLWYSRCQACETILNCKIWRKKFKSRKH